MNKDTMATGDVIGIPTPTISTHQPIYYQPLPMASNNTMPYTPDIHYVDPADLTRPVRHYSSAPFRRWKMRLDSCPPTHRSTAAGRYTHDLGCLTSTLKLPPTLSNCSGLIYVNRIFTHYIPRDFVTMRTGGASSSGFQSHKRILRDHLRA